VISELNQLASGQLGKHVRGVLRSNCIFVAVNIDRQPPPPSAIQPGWRHLKHVYADPDQVAMKQLGVSFAPQTVVIGKGGALVAARAPGIKGRLRARDLPELLVSLCEEDKATA
jgi:hypothetical protein